MTNTQVYLKSMTDEKAVIAGYGVVFDGRDLDDERFTQDTEFGLKHTRSIPVFYEHAMRGGDVEALDNEIGAVFEYKIDDTGLWVQAEIERSHEYADAVLQLVEQGVLGWSTGAASHLVRRDEKSADGVTTIKRWPIVEVSLTPTPAEPRTVGVARIKSQIISDGDPPEAEAEADTQPSADDTQPVTVNVTEVIHQPQEEIMTEETQNIEGRIDALTKSVGEILHYMQEVPNVKNAGYFSVDGGAADKNVKSFGDFLLSMVRGDTKRLHTVYNATKALNEDSGVGGGYVVPEEFSRRLMDIGFAAESWLGRVPRIPVNTASGRMPALDQTVTPTAGVGQTAAAAGVRSAKRAEGATYTETEPRFTQIEWKINDAISGYTEVTRELMQDSPISIEQVLTQLFGRVQAQRLAHFILNGNGVNEPLGILNSPAYLTSAAATANVFALADAANMVSRFRSFGAGEFLAHRTNLPDLASIWGSSAFAATVSPNVRLDGAAPSLGLFGYPISYTEALPLTDNTGSIILIDPTAYMLFEYGGLSIEYSEHVGFLRGVHTWKFSNRLDGQPMLKSTIREGNPGTAHQVSSFVGFTFAT